MTPDQIIRQIKKIGKSNPQNLMARHFDKSFFGGLDEELQQRLLKIVASGIANPDSQMGAYAMHPDDYDLFAPLLDPMIRDFHGIPTDVPIAQKHDWNTDTVNCDLAAIDPRLGEVSMRVRVARNIRSFPLPGAMSRQQRVELENIALSAFANLAADPDFGGQYLSLTPGSPNQISHADYESRVKAHQMFKDMSGDPYLNVAGISADWPHGRGIYISEKEDFLVWVGEEDHLRVMAMMRGGNLSALFDRLHSGLAKLRALLPEFATSPIYGNLTSCPTNLGAGMRASLHLRLPVLTENGADLTRVQHEARALGLAIRGAGGEHSGAGEGGLVDISPSARLGVTEMQIMRRLYDGTAALWAMETK